MSAEHVSDVCETDEPSEEVQQLPSCLDWTAEEVAEWVERLGYPQYKDCFISNHVTGRRLVWMEASILPRVGITDWKHMQHITGKVRELLHLESPYWNRTITLPYRSDLGIFLEKKSFTGRRADQLQFVPNENDDEQKE